MTKEQLQFLLDEIEKQNSWGKNQIRDLILQVASGLKG